MRVSTSTHPIIILSDYDVEDTFFSINYTPTSPDYSPATPRNSSSDFETESDPLEDQFEDRSVPLAITPFLDDSYHPNGMTFIHTAWKKDIDHMIPPILPRETKPPIGSPILSSLYSNCTDDGKVKFATGTLTKDALSWWNSFAQPIRIDKAYKTTGYKYHPLHVITYPLDQIRTDLSYAEEPEAIIDRQDRIMTKKIIPFVKILWRNHPEREATWETKESIRTSYPHFLP
nr:hypothetical protein [Tanacetum cinerariifolium]